MTRSVQELVASLLAATRVTFETLNARQFAAPWQRRTTRPLPGGR